MTATEVEVQVSPAPSIDVDVQFGDEPQIDVAVQIEPPTFTIMSVLPTGPRGPAGADGADGMGAVDSVNGETGVVVLDAADIPFTPNGSIAATDVQAAIVEVRDEAGAGGAPTTADYLVGTTQAGLSAEIVVGTSPGGELGGTWASPTVDATHSGSSHAGTQAAAEATAAAALSGHVAAADPHPGYLTPAEGNAAYDAAGAASTVDSALTAHINDATDAHDASAISILDTANDFTATDVEGALAELQTADEADEAALAAHLSDASDAHDASAVSYIPGGTVSATNVQDAIAEVAAEAGSGSLTDAVILAPATSVRNVIEGDGDVTELTLKADADGQTEPIFVVKNEEDVTIALVSPVDGAVFTAGYIVTTPLTVRAIAGQLVALAQFVTPTDDTLMSVDPDTAALSQFSALNAYALSVFLGHDGVDTTSLNLLGVRDPGRSALTVNNVDESVGDRQAGLASYVATDDDAKSVSTEFSSLVSDDGTAVVEETDADQFFAGVFSFEDVDARRVALVLCDDFTRLRLQARPGQSSPLLWLQDDSASSVARVLPSGAIGTLAGEPADADILDGECFRWFDSTDGAPRVMFKGKTLDGTVFQFDPQEMVSLAPATSVRNVIEGDGDVTELTLQAAVGQTEPVLIVQNSDGSRQVKVSPTGKVTVPTGATYAAAVEYTNSILYTALTAGVAGNDITVTLKNDGASQTLSVSEAGDAVTVHLGTDGGAAVESVVGDVVAIINSDSTKIRAEGIEALYDPDAIATAIATFDLTVGADSSSVPVLIPSADFTAQQTTLPVDGVITPYPWMAVAAEDAPFLAWGTDGEPFPRVCWFSGEDGLFLGDGTFDPYLGPAPNGEPLAYMQGGRDGEKTYFAFTAGLLKMYGGTTDAAHPGDHGGISFKAIGDGALVFSTAGAGSGGGPSFEDASTMLFEIREGKTWKVQVHLGAIGLYMDDSGPHLVVGIPAPIESDVKFDNNTVGPVIVDQSDGHTYRIICTNGALQTELVS